MLTVDDIELVRNLIRAEIERPTHEHPPFDAGEFAILLGKNKRDAEEYLASHAPISNKSHQELRRTK